MGVWRPTVISCEDSWMLCWIGCTLRQSQGQTIAEIVSPRVEKDKGQKEQGGGLLKGNWRRP